MKYHKIKNVPLEICTAEQKISYNLAFSNAHLFKSEYQKMPMQFQKNEVVYQALKFCMKQWRASYNFDSKYDIDSIFCCLNAGLENYIKNNCPILSSYEDIGSIFPANYL